VVRIHVATAGDLAHHDIARERFERLAELDSVGEHRLEPDPARADGILFVDLQQHPADPYLETLRRHPLVGRWAEKVYVYDERDFPVFTFPGAYVSAKASWAGRRIAAGAPYPSLPKSLRRNTDPSPDLLFSFMGSRTHRVRERVLGLKHQRGLLEDTTAPVHAPTRGMGAPLDEYARVIARSKFVLCPRGHGPSSFRLYETLWAGRVPVVISDAWVPPPRIDWSRCVVRVPEREVSDIPARLERCEPAWGDMVAAGSEVTRAHLAEDRLWHHYASTISSLRRARRPASLWWAQPRVLRVSVRRARHAVVQRDTPAGAGRRSAAT
jgi:hypothetical protein